MPKMIEVCSTIFYPNWCPSQKITWTHPEYQPYRQKANCPCNWKRSDWIGLKILETFRESNLHSHARTFPNNTDRFLNESLLTPNPVTCHRKTPTFKPCWILASRSGKCHLDKRFCYLFLLARRRILSYLCFFHSVPIIRGFEWRYGRKNEAVF